MVERTIDSIKIPGGMLIVLFKWTFYRLWTVLGIGASLYGIFLLLLLLVDTMGYPERIAARVAFVGTRTVVFYALAMLILGFVIAWYNNMDGDQTLFQRKQLALQVVATMFIFIFLMIYPGLHQAAIPMIVSLLS